MSPCARTDDRGRPRAVPSHVIRDHLTPFLDAGYLPATLALATGVTPQTIRKAVTGERRTVKAGTAQLLLALTHRACLDVAPDRAHVPAAGTTRRLQALALLGWSCDRIAAATGIRDSTIWRHLNAERRTTEARTARKVATFYDAHWSTSPTLHDHFEQGGATRARQHAQENGWHPALAWDDDTIDDPDATPETGQVVRGLGSGKRKVHVEDVDWLLSQVDFTWDGLAARLGVKPNTLDVALRRAGRQDLIDRLITNTRGTHAA